MTVAHCSSFGHRFLLVSYQCTRFLSLSIAAVVVAVVQRKRNQTNREGNSLHSTERRPLLCSVLTRCSTIDNEHCPFSSLSLCLSLSCSLSTGHRALTTLSPFLAFIHSLIHSLSRSRRHLVQQVCASSEAFPSIDTVGLFSRKNASCYQIPKRSQRTETSAVDVFPLLSRRTAENQEGQSIVIRR